MKEIEKKRLLLQLKRHEIEVDAGELRVLDLEAEIEKVKFKNEVTRQALLEKKKKVDDLINKS